MSLKIGKKASFSKTVTEADICTYAGLTGDFNPVHVNAALAENSIFGERVAHGMFSAGFISTVLGTKLSGNGVVYLSQSLNFIVPVKIGDTITAICEVQDILNEDKGIYKVKTVCINQNGKCVIDGEAVIKCLSVVNKNVSEKKNKEDSFYKVSELATLGLKRYGYNVLISRNAVLYNPCQLEIGNNVRIDDFTTISGKVVLGDYIHIAQFCGLYGGTEGIYMDDFAGLSSRVVIYAVSNDYSGESLTNPMVLSKYKITDKNSQVHLGKHVIIGTMSVILPGVTIGEGSSVGSLSMCSKNLDAWSVYAGCPVKKIKDRSKKLLELEKQLKAEEIGGGRHLQKNKISYLLYRCLKCAV